MNLKITALILACCAQLSCCSQSFSYPVINDVTKIEVTLTNSGKPIKNIDESSQIYKIIRFIDERRSRWCAPRFRSVPDAPVTLFFQHKSDGKAKIGFGKGFFVAEFASGQYKMEITDDEVRAFLVLIDASEDQLFR